MTDIVAYFARQYFEPNKYVRQKGAKGFYGRLTNVINQHATRVNTNFKIIEV